MASDPVVTPTPTHVVSNVHVAVSLNHGEKIKKFNRTEFKRWQQKMFYLTTLNLARFLHEDAPVLNKDETDREGIVVIDTWKHANFLC